MVKVITIKQPWATLIAKGYKKYEFRTWKTKYRGDILIHAGKSIDKDAMEHFKDFHLDYPQSCIIAKATITDCILVDDDFVKDRTKDHPLVYRNLLTNEETLYGFKLENVKEVNYIYINGQLGLWNYDMKE